MTRNESAVRAFSAALTSLTTAELDVADVLARLMADCARTADAGAVAVMATDSNGELSLLSAGSHAAVELEMWQLQRDAGPCVDVIRTGVAVHAPDPQQMRERWGDIGERIASAGYTAVEAYPMRWRGTTLGGLNIFHTEVDRVPLGALAQAFADVATLVVVHSAAMAADQMQARMHEALSARGIVEQAKGVLAYAGDLDLDQAYEALLARSVETGAPLTRTALDVVEQARSEPGQDHPSG